MSSFNNSYKNVNVNNNKNTGMSKTVFKEALKFIDSQWEKLNNDINKLIEDSETLQRMFTQYDKDIKFLELREHILIKINEKKNILNSLEKMILDIKVSISNSHSF
tara:strand:+ start:110 stop:427 length:318 start_codon:yes stop_codon:yes gene_type:complete